MLAGSGGLIAFDEYHQGRGITRNALISYFSGTPVIPVLAQIVLLILLVLWTRSRRFARPLPLPQVDRRSSLEFVASMAELQQSARAFDLAVENIYMRTRRVLSRYAGVDYNSPRSEISSRVAARSSLESQPLEALMRQCEEAINSGHVSGQEALQLVRRLRKVERVLGLRMRRAKSSRRRKRFDASHATDNLMDGPERCEWDDHPLKGAHTEWRRYDRTENHMLEYVSQTVTHIREQLRKVIVGQDAPIQQILIALLAEGHALIEGVPGTAKTLTVKTLSRIINANFGRIQFTPDLMPSDITGTNIFNVATSTFSLRPGPVFTDILLADEINRTPPKTQAALLEAMEERQVTIDGEGHRLSPIFTVLATENPIEYEGTYPLPEAQLDRFLLKILLDYPEEN